MHFMVISLPEILLVLKHKHVKLAWRIPNYCHVSSQGNDIIKLMHYDEKKKMAHDSHIVRAKENLKLSHGGPSYSQASATNPPIKALRRAVIESA